MKRERKARAKNKIQGSLDTSLITVEPEPYEEPPGVHLRSQAIVVARPTIFNAVLEEAIDLIARERVYRAMLAGLGRRLLMAPSAYDPDEPKRP